MRQLACLVLWRTDFCALQTTDFQYTSNAHTHSICAKLHTPHTNRARIHPWRASFLNLSIIHILFLFNKTTPFQRTLSRPLEWWDFARVQTNKTQTFYWLKTSFKNGVHFKKEDMRILFSTLLESSKVKTSKSTQRTKKCLGRYTSSHWNCAKSISSRQDVCP